MSKFVCKQPLIELGAMTAMYFKKQIESEVRIQI